MLRITLRRNCISHLGYLLKQISWAYKSVYTLKKSQNKTVRETPKNGPNLENGVLVKTVNVSTSDYKNKGKVHFSKVVQNNEKAHTH